MFSLSSCLFALRSWNCFLVFASRNSCMDGTFHLAFANTLVGPVRAAVVAASAGMTRNGDVDRFPWIPTMIGGFPID